MQYYTFVQRFAEQTGTIKQDANVSIIIPSAIDYAEQRLYRELDLLGTVVTDATTQVSSGVRNFSLPTGTGTYITVDQINIITPAATTPTSSGATRVPLTAVTRDFLDASYPTIASSLAGTPEYYSMRSNNIVAFGPVPDAAYYAEVIGTQRPKTLSSANSSTILTQYVPDVFLAAAMVYAAEYLRNDSPENTQLVQSYEQQYQTLMKSAAVEQFRAKFQSEGWTSKQPNPLAKRV